MNRTPVSRTCGASRLRHERGSSLVVVMLLLALSLALAGGFMTTIASDARLRVFDRADTQAFYAAHGALEKLTADLGNLFLTTAAPASGAIAAIARQPPAFAGVTFGADGNCAGYAVRPADGEGSASGPEARELTTGPFQGLTALVDRYTLCVAAGVPAAGLARVHLEREMNTVAIPLFQFGLFSDGDVSVFAGGDFAFDGRIHTNGNLYLAAADGGETTLSGRITAAGDVVRTHLANGWPTSNGYNGAVRLARGAGAVRALARNEGSLIGTVGSAVNPRWPGLSEDTYNFYIRNSRTGARRLELPLVGLGAEPIDLIRRPVPGEDPRVTAQRYYSLASVRILLSDDENKLRNLPDAGSGEPVSLLEKKLDDTPLVKANVGEAPIIEGFIRIELRRQDGAWIDRTWALLESGISNCPESFKAVVRLERWSGTSCNDETGNYEANVLYDAREGNLRDQDRGLALGGLMHYVELDVENLGRWLREQEATNPIATDENGGYTVYFSDRRGDGDNDGEYGFEDIVNPGSPNGIPNNRLDGGEDINGNGRLDTFDEPLPPDDKRKPWDPKDDAQKNAALFFRRALKLVDGQNIPVEGLTIASENPVYIQGNYNASPTTFDADEGPAAAVIADAVTLLSVDWNDEKSLGAPHDPGGRRASPTWYRLAVLSGKGLSFPNPPGTRQDFGTDGGVHNFLRLLEDWGNADLHFRGALASLFTSRQAVGTYKCCETVYRSPRTRDFQFDDTFRDPHRLPPHTPMFRDVNTTAFRRIR